MKKIMAIYFSVFLMLVAGCAQVKTAFNTSYELQAMSRLDGKIYHGKAQQDRVGSGQGIISITIGDAEYSGKFSLTSMEQYSTFINANVQGNSGSSAYAFGTGTANGANVTFMALLSTARGDGMRCAFNGVKSGTGGGLCVDAQKVIYDVLYSKSEN